MNYNSLSSEAYRIAVAKGFWNCIMSHEHYLTLVICEICEAIEAHRKSKHADKKDYLHALSLHKISQQELYENLIKGSIEEEFADALIRLFSFAGHLEIDFDRLSPCKYYRAFHRFSFTENAFALIKGFGRDSIIIERRVQFAIEYVKGWGESIGIDLPFHIEEKMKYTESATELTVKAY